MWIRTISCLTVMLMVLSAAEDVGKNLTGVVGGNITLPDPTPERGFLLIDKTIIASVSPLGFEILEDIYQNKVHWDKNSGLFMITDLQKNNSGVYTVDSKKGQVFTKSYNLRIYDSAPTPAVEMLNGSSDGCRLRCFVDKQTSLLWYKDEEILNQNHSVFSLIITVQKQKPDSLYKCVSANPAVSKTFHVDLRTLCGFNYLKLEAEEGNRLHWAAYVVPILIILMIVFVACLIKQRYLRKTNRESLKDEEVQYTSIQIKSDRRNQGGNPPESSRGAENANLTSIYATLEHH
uniref:Ig-like domain-containing protein n=1 Tax=Iconisemion striatum TaxID=60296 RepID=A0A1A7WB48_9TELE